MNRWATGTIILFFVLSSFLYGQEPVTLRYKANRETKLIYKRVTKLDQQQTVKEMKFKTKIVSTDFNVVTYLGKDDKGNLKLQTENKGMKVKMELPQVGEYTFDSAKETNDKESTLGNALTPVYERLNGSIMTLIVSPDGELKKIEGYDELMKDVLKNNPIGAQFSGGGSEDAARLNFAEFYPLLPKNGVRPGDTWERPYVLKLPKIGKVEGKRRYQYEGMVKQGKRQVAKILVNSELAIDLNLNQGGAKVTGNMSITDSKGTIFFDPQAGNVVSVKNQITMGGLLNVTVGDQNIQVNSEQTQSIQMDLLDRLPK